jgi:hypothetical protein
LPATSGSKVLLGVTDADATDATDSPLPLTAFTVNVYEVLLLKPVRVSGEVVPEMVAPLLAKTT